MKPVITLTFFSERRAEEKRRAIDGRQDFDHHDVNFRAPKGYRLAAAIVSEPPSLGIAACYVVYVGLRKEKRS